MTPEEFAAASNLSSAYEGNAGYTGSGDVSVQFNGGASSFVDENKTGLHYSMTIKNIGANSVDRLIALLPAYLSLAADIKDASGSAVAAVIKEGAEVVGTIVGGDALSANGSPKSINEFLGFLKNNPTRFTGLKMKVDDSAQFEENIYIKQMSPFRNLTDDVIVPANYKDSNQTDDKRVEIPLENFQMDSNTIVIMKVLAGRTITMTWFAGAIKNQSYELAVKAAVARQNSGVGRAYGKR
jgi:hypothetical protein